MPTYYGFSTVAPESQRKFVLTDNDLIKQDILNVLMTKRGSRVMFPNYGCIVWEKLFENITQSDVSDIAENIKAIIANDPRVLLSSIDIAQNDNNTITVSLDLKYVSSNQLDKMIVLFDSEGVS